jgi:predicted AAA+ superfamily ATPase
MVRQIQPWHANIKKRQVKSPKVYIRDTGILNALLGLKTKNDILRHPSCGASWEGYVIEQIIHSAEPDDFYYWATHQGAEVDLILFKNGRRYGVEIKRADAPALTPSIRVALNELKLDHVAVVYPGDKRYEIRDKVSVVPFKDVSGGMPRMFNI